MSRTTDLETGGSNSKSQRRALIGSAWVPPGLSDLSAKAGWWEVLDTNRTLWEAGQVQEQVVTLSQYQVHACEDTGQGRVSQVNPTLGLSFSPP